MVQNSVVLKRLNSFMILTQRTKSEVIQFFKTVPNDDYKSSTLLDLRRTLNGPLVQRNRSFFIIPKQIRCI